MNRLLLTMVLIAADRCIDLNDHGRSPGAAIPVRGGSRFGHGGHRRQGLRPRLHLEDSGRARPVAHDRRLLHQRRPGWGTARRWWGPGAQALGFTPGQMVEQPPYECSPVSCFRRSSGAQDKRTEHQQARSRMVLPQTLDPHRTADLVRGERPAAVTARIRPRVHNSRNASITEAEEPKVQSGRSVSRCPLGKWRGATTWQSRRSSAATSRRSSHSARATTQASTTCRRSEA